MMTRVFVVLSALLLVVLGLASRTDAAPIVSGDVFRITFTDTDPIATAFLNSDPSQTVPVDPNPDYLSVTSADFVLGAPLGASLFAISQITNTVGAPVFSTVDFSALAFNADLLGLTGHMTATFVGGGGGQHVLVVTPSLPPAPGSPGTWAQSDNHVDGGFTVVTHGIYTAAPVPVPEPSTLLLLGSGASLLAARRRRTKAA